ncbi:SHPRH, partial [Symbiodinium sp. CCMP2456]
DGVEISKPSSKSEIMSMSQEISVTFPGSLLKSKLDITVGRTDSRWRGSLIAEVQKVGPKTKKHLGDEAPQVGDLVERLFCSGLKKPDGSTFTMSSKEVSLVQRCLKGEIRCYVSERTPIGGKSSGPHFPFRRTRSMAEGQVTPKSKVTLTLKRPPKNCKDATHVVGSPSKRTSS